MKYPCLIPKKLCNTPVQIHLESEELNKLGEPEKVLDIHAMCNYQDQVKTILTAEKKLVEVNGTAFFCGDIAEEFLTISSGTVIIFGEERKIENGSKARNPDGTVNYTKIEVS